MKKLILLLTCLLIVNIPSADAPRAEISRLDAYHAELNALRSEHGSAHVLPNIPFFLLGMGPRIKLLYKVY